MIIIILNERLKSRNYILVRKLLVMSRERKAQERHSLEGGWFTVKSAMKEGKKKRGRGVVSQRADEYDSGHWFSVIRRGKFVPGPPFFILGLLRCFSSGGWFYVLPPEIKNNLGRFWEPSYFRRDVDHNACEKNYYVVPFEPCNKNGWKRKKKVDCCDDNGDKYGVYTQFKRDNSKMTIGFYKDVLACAMRASL